MVRTLKLRKLKTKRRMKMAPRASLQPMKRTKKDLKEKKMEKIRKVTNLLARERREVMRKMMLVISLPILKSRLSLRKRSESAPQVRTLTKRATIQWTVRTWQKLAPWQR